MKKEALILLFLFLIPSALACSIPLDGKTYTESQKFCARNYYLPNGINIGTNGITIDCQGGILQGDFKFNGINIENKRNIEIKNCHIVNYNYGIRLKNATNAHIHDNSFLRSWYGIRLEDSKNNYILNNRDVSIKKIIRSTLSENNHIRYTNKNVEGDICRHNSCNKNTPVKKIDDYRLENTPLSRILKKTILSWISMG